jgi:CelD/BcsL family acetyltransferase involved in cellulose biosynthesis
MQIRRVQTEEEFATLAPQWADVLTGSGETSPLVSHDWFRCCWQTVTGTAQPEVLVVEDGGRPVAFVPLMRWRERNHGVPVRSLGLLECPDSVFIDVVAAGDLASVAQAFGQHLASRRDWDVLTLKLRATSASLKAMDDALRARFAWRPAGKLQSPYVAVGGGWEPFWRGKTQRFRKTLRNVQNRLERAGKVTVEEHRELDPHSPLFHEVLELTSRSWKADRHVAIATMPRMPEFFAELTRRASKQGWLSLWLLRLDGRLIAMEWQLQAGGRVYALRSDFDEAYGELSPGSALNLAIMQGLFERPGVHEYDMGPGLSEYKLRWATGTHETLRIRVYASGVRGRAAWVADMAVAPLVRRIKERLR